MRMRRAVRLMTCAIAVVASVSLTGQAKPDYSGNWVLNKAASRLDGPIAAVESGTVHIEHREPTFTFQRTFVVGGMSYDMAYTQTTDGKEVVTANQQGGGSSRSRLLWDGGSLVLDVKMTTPGGPVDNVVRYELAEGGRVLHAIEDVTGPATHHNVWVFDRR